MQRITVMWILSRTGRGNLRESWTKCTENVVFHVLRYNFNKSGISGAEGRKAKRIRCYYGWETRSAMCRINLSPYIAQPYVRLATFIFTDFHAVRCGAIGWGLREYFLISGRSSGVRCSSQYNRGLCPGPIFTGCPPLFVYYYPESNIPKDTSPR